MLKMVRSDEVEMLTDSLPEDCVLYGVAASGRPVWPGKKSRESAHAHVTLESSTCTALIS